MFPRSAKVLAINGAKAQADASFKTGTALIQEGYAFFKFNKFYDKLKSYSKGYASFDYQVYDYFQGDLVKLNILVNSETVDAFSNIVHKTRAETIGRRICNKLKDLIPRQNFQIPIQAAIYGKIIARETIKAFRKDVTAKLYGGDVSRKKKLLEKQKKGKKRMKQFGNVEICLLYTSDAADE